MTFFNGLPYSAAAWKQNLQRTIFSVFIALGLVSVSACEDGDVEMSMEETGGDDDESGEDDDDDDDDASECEDWAKNAAECAIEDGEDDGKDKDELVEEAEEECTAIIEYMSGISDECDEATLKLFECEAKLDCDELSGPEGCESEVSDWDDHCYDYDR